MKLILDTADTKAIAQFNDILTIDGVTTNPSIIVKSGKQAEEVIQEIISLLDDDQKLFIQAIANDVEGIVKEAEWIHSLRDKNMYVKIPVSEVGYKAIKECKKRGFNVLATAIYSANQAFLAALNGADCVAPYVNRMCNFQDGIQEVLDLQTMLEKHNLNTYIVAASFKNTKQVHDLIKGGIEAVTIPIDVAAQMIDHPATQQAINTFEKDWHTTYNRNTLV